MINKYTYIEFSIHTYIKSVKIYIINITIKKNELFVKYHFFLHI